MTRFQLCWHGFHHSITGTLQVHARLSALRSDQWTVVGVFQLAEQEWRDLVTIAEQLGVEVMEEVGAN
jgi:hypothetical protein